MALSVELAEFCHRWRAKAQAYPSENLRDVFDRFFTLYVAFNRLYAEATFRLAQRGEIKLHDRFPDSGAAKDNVVKFCGAKDLTSAWEDNPDTNAALQRIADHLRQGRFALKLHPVTGDRQRDADLKLSEALESGNKSRRAKAGLEVLYAIRCNMFHGRKGFEHFQVELLAPAIRLLDATIDVLYRCLEGSRT